MRRIETNTHLLQTQAYLKLRKHRLRQVTSTSFKFAESERFKFDKWQQFALNGMTTFLIFGHPTQLRFCNKRGDCSLDSGIFSLELALDRVFAAGKFLLCPQLHPQFKSCIFKQPFKLTWVRFVQQARSSSMADWEKVP